MAQLRRKAGEFQTAGARVVLVGMGSPEESTAFARKFKVPYPIICDPDRNLYLAFDLKRMSPLGFLSPTLVLKGISAVADGHFLGLPQGDVRQLPGVFIVDTEGRIVYGHYAADPSDHPDPATLLAALAR